MENNRPSDTAMGAAVIRAVHQLCDELPHILEDPVSLRLMRPETIKRIQEDPTPHKSRSAKALRSHVVLRSRFAEDELRFAVESGARQFVSLGAGFDTFPCRQPEWAKALKIVEMDHPATQSRKRLTFEKSGISFPENVGFSPVNFEENEIAESLSAAGINLDLPVFLSCLGVFAYFRAETVHKVFRGISGLKSGSRLVFTFAGKESGKLAALAERTGDRGEPWLSRFSVEELGRILGECGFSKIEFLSPEETAVRYYKGRNDLPAPGTCRICSVEV